MLPLEPLGHHNSRPSKSFLAVYRKKRAKPVKPALYEHASVSSGGEGPCDVLELLETLPPAWADHAIASVYASLIPAERHKTLGAYFTPPHLVDHLVAELRGLWVDPVATPAARSGGGRRGVSRAAGADQGRCLAESGSGGS